MFSTRWRLIWNRTPLHVLDIILVHNSVVTFTWRDTWTYWEVSLNYREVLWNHWEVPRTCWGIPWTSLEIFWTRWQVSLTYWQFLEFAGKLFELTKKIFELAGKLYSILEGSLNFLDDFSNRGVVCWSTWETTWAFLEVTRTIWTST